MQEVSDSQTAANIPDDGSVAGTNNTGNSDHSNNVNGVSDNGVIATPPTAPVVQTKPKKKRANPVYITPVRKRERKRSCSDSDNEDGITGDDSAWGPGGKRKKKGKKKAGGAGGKGKGRKNKKDDSD